MPQQAVDRCWELAANCPAYFLTEESYLLIRATIEPMKYLLIILSTALVNNVVLVKFLGLCPVMGVSSKLDSALGMGLATTFVLTLAALAAGAFCTAPAGPRIPAHSHFYFGNCGGSAVHRDGHA